MYMKGGEIRKFKDLYGGTGVMLKDQRTSKKKNLEFNCKLRRNILDARSTTGFNLRRKLGRMTGVNVYDNIGTLGDELFHDMPKSLKTQFP